MASITASTTILDSYAHARIARLEEQVAELQAVVNRGGQELAKAPVKKPAAAGRPKKEILAAPPKPEDGDDAPDAADYRLTPSDITEDVCVGRILKGNEDKRWSPAVYSESQCGGDLLDGDDLCKTCRTRADKFAENPTSKSDWNGRVTEEPLARSHMLGTAWAASSLPKWKGGAAAVGGAGTDTASIVSSSDSSASGKMSVAEAKAATKATKAAAVVAEKAAAKAAKAAAAVAEKEAAKAAKEAEKAATKATKDAEKAAAKAAKASAAATKAVKEPKAKKEATTAVAAKAEVAAEVVETEGEMKAIEGTLYMLKGKKLYEYDMFSNASGAFVGILGADGDSIDRDAKEEDDDEE
jgi:chemotaxis protein histidine kinase CheA